MTKRKYRHPPRWLSATYRLLATGRYAVLWLPELFILYDLALEEDGEDNATEWALKELTTAFGPGLGRKVHLLFQTILLVRRIYKKLAGD
jgi:hypothetical protein